MDISVGFDSMTSLARCLRRLRASLVSPEGHLADENRELVACAYTVCRVVCMTPQLWVACAWFTCPKAHASPLQAHMSHDISSCRSSPIVCVVISDRWVVSRQCCDNLVSAGVWSSAAVDRLSARSRLTRPYDLLVFGPSWPILKPRTCLVVGPTSGADRALLVFVLS